MSKHRIKPPVPQDDRRGCLCWETNTYSRECCDGDDYHAQGLGSIYAEALSCQSITLSGFEVAQDGTITEPTTNVGTITETSPASFEVVDTETTRELSVSILVPEGKSNAGSTITCTTSAIQTATPALVCGDITISGFAVAEDGTITTPTIDIGTISSTSPASFDRVNVDTTRTLTLSITVPSGYFNVGETLECTTTAIQSASATLACEDITISGFAVDENGAITQPTIDIGTFTSSPASFATVTVNTVRTLTLDITVPSGYYNTGDILVCTTTATQPPYNVLDCNDVSITGFSVFASGNYDSNAVSVDIGTIDSMTPASFGTVTTETTRTLTVNIIGPSGYSNEGQTISCTTTATQLAAFFFEQITPSIGNYVAVEPIASSGNYAFSVYANDPVTSKTNALALCNQLGSEIRGQATSDNASFLFQDKRVSFYSPTDVLLARYETDNGIINSFQYTSPDTLGSVPSSPYGGNASNWTSYQLVFSNVTSVSGQVLTNPTQEMIIDNNNDEGYYWVVEDLS